MRPHDTKPRKRYAKGSGKLNNIMRWKPGSGCPHRVLMDRRLTMVDMSIIKHDDAVANSRRKREGRLPPAESRHVVCGCGMEGCLFVSSWKS